MFQDGTRTLSWSIATLISLILAGCGGDSASNATGGEPQTTEQVASQEHTRPDKQYRQREPSTPQTSRPEVQIEDPILSEPLPVPVPAGEGPEPDLVEEDPVPKDQGRREGDAAGDDSTEVADPEPKAEQPDPVVARPTLHWEGPLTREDGSKLYPGEISGYRIYYRLRHQDDFRSLTLEGPDADSLPLDDFEPGAWEFAVSTLDTNGLESRRSEPVPVDLI